MGGIRIVFRGSLHGVGTTSAMLAIAMSITESFGLTCAVTSLGQSLCNPEELLMKRELRNNLCEDTGMDVMIRYFKAGVLEDRQMNSCAISLTERLDFIPGPEDKGLKSNLPASLSNFLLSKLSTQYDVVLIDAGIGRTSQAEAVIAEADLEIVCLRQSMRVLEALSLKEGGTRRFYLFTDYDGRSRYSLKNLRHLSGRLKRYRVGCLPHNTGFMDAGEEANIIGYFLQGMDEKATPDAAFFKAVKETSEAILKEVHL